MKSQFLNKIKIFIIVLISAYTHAIAQVSPPAPPQSQPIAIKNATAHLGNGKVIKNAIITFENGKIQNIAEASADISLENHKVIDALDKHIYPGLILPMSVIGLVEIEAVRATIDFNETGKMNPHVRSIVAYNTESEVLPTMKFAGIQIAQIIPSGNNLVDGTSTIVQLDAWDWQGAIYKENDGMIINWPQLSFPPRWWMGETERKNNEEYNNQVASIEQLINDTKTYIDQSKSTKNLKLEAMIPVIKGEKGLFVVANSTQEILDAIKTLKKHNIPNIVLVGARDVWYVKDFIKSHNIPVLLGGVHDLPSRDDEDTDLPYKLPALLHKEGILVGLYHNESYARSRNLPFYAGTVAGYGLEKEEALKLITSNNAKILKIDGQTGTLEKGKDANIIISEGDIMDMRSSKITHSFIQGREVNLQELQQNLYLKFKEKYSKK